MRVSEDNYECDAEEERVKVCICAHHPFGLSLFECQFKEDQKDKILRSLICVAATSRPELVFFLVFKTSAGTSDEVRCGDLSPCL